MFPLLLLFLVGGAVAVAVSKSGDGNKTEKTPSGLPVVNSLSIAIWESPKSERSKGATAIPLDKLNTRGQKFIDPCGIAFGTKGYENVMSLPSDGKVRMTFVHSRAQSMIPKPMPAADVLIAAAGNLGLKATKAAKRNLVEQQDAWISEMRRYGRMTANGYVIAFVEFAAILMKALPMEWTAVYQRSKTLAEDAANTVSKSLVASIAYGAPYPLHILDVEPSSVGDVQSLATRMEGNLGQFTTLPDSAKNLISSWFALLAMNTDKEPVQRAIMATDDTEWGKANLASDDQVYLAAAVFASALNEPVLPFAIELWNRSQGWSRWKGLTTNARLVPPSVAIRDGVVAYDQGQRSVSLLGYWFNPDKDPETGYSWASNCISNARMLNWLDILLTGWVMVGERSGQSPISDKMIKLPEITAPTLPAPPTPKG